MFFKNLIRTVRENKLLWILYGFFFLIGLGIAIAFPREESLLWVNSKHTPIADFIMKYWTFFGDGKSYIFFILLTFWYHRRWGIIALSCFAVTTLITQILKHFVFENVQRPPGVIPNEFLHFVTGDKVEFFHSFPSGHATTMFTLVFMVSVLLRSQSLKLLIFFIGLIAIYTRMYLAKHFLIDITIGSFIGMIFSLLTFTVLQTFFWTNKSDKSHI